MKETYLTELLLDKDYGLHGIKRRASSFNTCRINHLYEDPHKEDVRLFLHYRDMTDSSNLIRILDLEETTRFYQASTSELYAYWITVNYREAHGIHASNGILFNHESPRRGETFVTRKITRAAARIKLGLQEKTYLGNLDAKRDWGHARDYVEGMYRMLQQDAPGDYVLATGRTTTVREFATLAFKAADIELAWEGEGEGEKGYDVETGRCVVEIDLRYYRPTEVELLLGDAAKARKQLDWTPKCSLEEIAAEMVTGDIKEANEEMVVQKDS